MRKFIKKLKNSIAWKLLKILFTLVKWVVEIVIIGIAIIIITQRVTNSQKAFLGIRILLFLGIVAGVVVALVSVINLIPADFDIRTVWGTMFWEIQDFLNT